MEKNYDVHVKQKMCRFRSSCICPKYHPGLCSPFIHSVVSNDSVSGVKVLIRLPGCISLYPNTFFSWCRLYAEIRYYYICTQHRLKYSALIKVRKWLLVDV